MRKKRREEIRYFRVSVLGDPPGEGAKERRCALCGERVLGGQYCWERVARSDDSVVTLHEGCAMPLVAAVLRNGVTAEQLSGGAGKGW